MEHQLLLHFDIHFLESNKTIQSLQNTFCSDSHQIIDFLNNNKKLSNSLEDRLVEINHAGSKLNQIVYNDCSSYLKTSPLLLCGGEHGVGIGYVSALADQYSSFCSRASRRWRRWRGGPGRRRGSARRPTPRAYLSRPRQSASDTTRSAPFST